MEPRTKRCARAAVANDVVPESTLPMRGGEKTNQPSPALGRCCAPRKSTRRGRTKEDPTPKQPRVTRGVSAGLAVELGRRTDRCAIRDEALLVLEPQWPQRLGLPNLYLSHETA